MTAPALTDKTRRSLRLLAWAALPVLALAGVVQITGVGIDILVLATTALLLFGLERSLGDLLGEWFGPLASAMILVVGVAGLSWYFLADSLGRPRTDRFFAEAERRGYHTVYYQTARSTADESAVSSAPAGASQPVATGGGAVSVATSSPEDRAEPRGGDRLRTEAATVDKPAGPPSRTSKPGRTAAATRAFRSFFRRNTSSSETVATEVTVSLDASRVQAAHRAVISAAVRSGGEAVTSGTVEFMVNGLGAGRVHVNADGVASTTFRTHIPGTYEVLARFSALPPYASSRSKPVLLNVVGAR